MTKLVKATTARLLEEAENCLCSLGVALLVLSVLLVPTSGLLADTGGRGPLVPVVCLANNGCNNGCAQVMSNGSCNGRPNTSDGCTGDTECSNCGCSGCKIGRNGAFCNCQCQASDSGCSNNTTCNPN